MSADVNVIPDEKSKKRKSGKICCAPGCTSGTSQFTEVVAYHRFPKSLREVWLSKIPRKDWNPPQDPRLCEKHFTSDSYKVVKADTKNPWRASKEGTKLSRKCLKPDAVPTVWPNCPHYLTECNPTPRQSKNSTGLRASTDEKSVFDGVPSETAELMQLSDISDFDKNLNTERIPPSVSFICKGTKRIFVDMSCENDRPVTKYSIILDENLHLSIVVDGVLVRQDELVNVLAPSDATLETCDQFYKILSHLHENHGSLNLDSSIVDHVLEKLDLLRMYVCIIID